MEDLERAFSEFIDRQEYDKAENALFDIVRIAFVAGWNAAGGQLSYSQKVVRLVNRGDRNRRLKK